MRHDRSTVVTRGEMYAHTGQQSRVIRALAKISGKILIVVYNEAPLIAR